MFRCLSWSALVPRPLSCTALAAGLLVASLSIAAHPVPAPAGEPVDWVMVNRIREEGMHCSQVMETLAYMSDHIGPRLTGSPGMKEANKWTRDKLAEWGLENARLEGFDFGRGWSFSRTSVHMLEPREALLIALPKGWTPGTDGPVRGRVMKVSLESEKDFEQYRGKLAGKILFLDDGRELLPGDEPAVRRFSDEELEEIESFTIPGERRGEWRERSRKRWRFGKKLNDFLIEEGALATVGISSRDGGLVRVMGGGSREVGGNPGVPSLVMAAEHYNWILRLLGETPGGSGGPGGRPGRGGPPARGGSDGWASSSDDGEEGGEEAEPEEEESPVELEIDVRARFHDDDSQAYNKVAEIPGTGDGMALVGAHLDSWHAGTGATDNAARGPAETPRPRRL